MTQRYYSADWKCEDCGEWYRMIFDRLAPSHPQYQICRCKLEKSQSSPTTPINNGEVT